MNKNISCSKDRLLATDRLQQDDSCNKSLPSPNYFDRGLKYVEQQKYLMAIQSFSQAANFQPNAVVYFYRGLAYSSLGQQQKAIADYSTAIKLEPDYREAYYHRGRAYYYSDDLERCIADLTRAIEFIS